MLFERLWIVVGSEVTVVYFINFLSCGHLSANDGLSDW